MSISVGAVVSVSVSSTATMALTPAAVIAAAARVLLAARNASSALNAPAPGADTSAWCVETVGSPAERDIAITAERAADGALDALLLTASPELLGPCVQQMVDASDGIYFPEWCVVDLAASTTPAQRRTMFRLAVAYGHEWGGCLEPVWIDHGIALWASGDSRLPGGIGPRPDHMTATGRTRWEVQADGSVEWEVWRGWRHTSETFEGLRDETTPATPSGRAVVAEWCGMEHRTAPRPESAAPECVLRGRTSPSGEEVVEWRSHLCEERHEDATPFF